MKKILTICICVIMFALGVQQAQAEFDRNLTVGSTGGDVVGLQVFLIEKGYLVMSAGEELGYFGNGTKTALAKYQAAVGLEVTGYFGPLTREKVASDIANSPELEVDIEIVKTSVSTTESDVGDLGDFKIVFKVIAENQDIYLDKNNFAFEILNTSNQVVSNGVKVWLKQINSVSGEDDVDNLYPIEEGDSATFELHTTIQNVTGKAAGFKVALKSLDIGVRNNGITKFTRVTDGIDEDFRTSSLLLQSADTTTPPTNTGTTPIATPIPIPKPTPIGKLPSIEIKKPVGGEVYKAGTNIKAHWQAKNLNASPKMTAYVYNPDLGNVLKKEIKKGAPKGNGAGQVEFKKEETKNLKQGQYRIAICDENTDSPVVSGKPYCMNGAYFTIQGNDATSTNNQSKTIKVNSPKNGDVYDNGPSQSVAISWDKYVGNFEYYRIFVYNDVAAAGSMLPYKINKASTGYKIRSVDIQNAIKKVTAQTPPNKGYTIRIIAIKNDRAGEMSVAEGTSGVFEISVKGTSVSENTSTSNTVVNVSSTSGYPSAPSLSTVTSNTSGTDSSTGGAAVNVSSTADYSSATTLNTSTTNTTNTATKTYTFTLSTPRAGATYRAGVTNGIIIRGSAPEIPNSTRVKVYLVDGTNEIFLREGSMYYCATATSDCTGIKSPLGLSATIPKDTPAGIYKIKAVVTLAGGTTVIAESGLFNVTASVAAVKGVTQLSGVLQALSHVLSR